MTAPTPLADRLVAAFSNYDPSALEPLLAPEVRHWVNITKREQGRDEMLRQVAAEGAHISTARFALRHHVETAEGFVVQLVVSGETKGGAAFEVPVCLVVTTTGDQVVRVDEYASLHHAEPIMSELFGTA